MKSDGLNYSMYNKETLKKTDKCGCFYCLNIFNPNEITKWTDENNTAICPYCGVDSIIPETNDIEITKEYLTDLNIEFFKGSSSL